MKQQFSRFVFGILERDQPVDVELLPDRMLLAWGMWFWKAREEIPWSEMTIVPASTIGLGNDPNWDSKGLALRRDTTSEPHRSWKCIWLPCKPNSPFYAEVQRLIATFRPTGQA